MFCVEHDSTASPLMAGHDPVLLQECLRLLDAERGGLFIDATFGGGGHTRALLEAHPRNEVIAYDCDPQAAVRAEEISAAYAGRFAFRPFNFRELVSFADGDKHRAVQGVLFDLGVSSFQLDEAVRGFSFRSDAPLDMRMDPREGAPASAFLETAPQEEIVRAVRDFGEERRWKRVVRAILAARGTGKLQRTGVFAALVAESLGPAARAGRIHPATQTFQGVRIAVNGELESVERALPAALELLAPEGRLAVISFHSLEDRLVKRFFRKAAGRPEHAADARSVMERHAVAQLLTNRPITPGPDELEQNSRSRSAKLRVLRKLPLDEITT